ncbi:MAG TPA: hypothetical protein VHE34_22330 [Puia sp.]|uniref:hypothetical protein n=1 Tax=Puia sp. TaxID=2045100 RepID=UPI002BC9D095|nr:hypothetical protein [Puia sp.]HVU97985.1 hypothetical protein [Puia sp.]
MAGNKSRTRHVAFVLSLEEYQVLQRRFAASTSPGFSAFLRDILFRRPVVFRYHNADADEFLVIALEIKCELEKAVDFFIHSSTSCPDEGLSLLLSKIDELKLIMHQIYQQWSST